ncbi:hypothetical protein KEM48_006627 [Puccinia striiformis f. sp. tritici PST-130]|nr:hypothetical protein KEM48_006627 [Puccinia striiformis f. sp. tritici PST-130]
MPFRYVSSSQKPNEESQDAASLKLKLRLFSISTLNITSLQVIPIKSFQGNKYPDRSDYRTLPVRCLRQLGKSKIWVAKVDPKGYWQPNVNVVLPIFATAHGIVLRGFDALRFGGPVRPSTVSFEAGALLLLHCLNWSKTWVTLYAMPCNAEGPHLAQPPTRLSSRFAKPYLFNSLVFLGYAAPVLIGLPLMILPASFDQFSSSRLSKFDWQLESLGNQSLADAPLSSWLSNPTVALKIKNLKSGGEHTHHYSKLFAIMLISIHSINYSCSGNTSNLENSIQPSQVSRTEARKEPGFDKSDSASLDSRGNGFIVTIEELEKSEPKKNDTASHWLDWKVITPCLRRGTEVGAELWKSDLIRHLDEEDQVLQSKLEAEYLTLRQYTANTMWQALLIFMISGCYITMGVAYVFNWEDAPIAPLMLNYVSIN